MVFFYGSTQSQIYAPSSVPGSAVYSEGEGDLKFLASSYSTMLNNLLNNDMFFLKKNRV